MYGDEEPEELDTEMQLTPPALLPPRRGQWWFQRPQVRLTGYAVLVALLLLTVVATTRISLIHDRAEKRRFWWDTLVLAHRIQSHQQHHHYASHPKHPGIGTAATAAALHVLVDHSSVERHCNNSRQGKEWVVDNTGRLCRQGQQDEVSGCCPTEQQQQQQNVSRFACDGCLPTTGCCTVYEFCVACCLGPSAAGPLKASLARAGVSWSPPADVDVAAAARFPLCLALCRTSSGSVMRQRFYKSATHRYCWRPD